ncbi:TPA: Gfo/Idh/MocA family oxidoreductase, partial [Streptococcus agalactiae]
MLQLGIVGLGGISQKAYLPYMRQVTGVHWHLFTRQKQILEEVNMLFGSSTAYDSLDSLAEHPLDGVFIHVATSAHFDIAKLFLKKGIPVFMDKPLTEDYTSTKA